MNEPPLKRKVPFWVYNSEILTAPQKHMGNKAPTGRSLDARLSSLTPNRTGVQLQRAARLSLHFLYPSRGLISKILSHILPFVLSPFSNPI